MVNVNVLLLSNSLRRLKSRLLFLRFQAIVLKVYITQEMDNFLKRQNMHEILFNRYKRHCLHCFINAKPF